MAAAAIPRHPTTEPRSYPVREDRRALAWCAATA